MSVSCQYVKTTSVAKCDSECTISHAAFLGAAKDRCAALLSVSASAISNASTQILPLLECLASLGFVEHTVNGRTLQVLLWVRAISMPLLLRGLY